MFSNDVENPLPVATDLRRGLSLRSTAETEESTIDISLATPGRSLSFKKDSNWDFGKSDGDLDTKRPAIYVIELGTAQNFREMPPSPKREV